MKKLGLGSHGTFNLGEEINIKLIVTQNIVKITMIINPRRHITQCLTLDMGWSCKMGTGSP